MRAYKSVVRTKPSTNSATSVTWRRMFHIFSAYTFHLIKPGKENVGGDKFLRRGETHETNAT